MKAILLWLASPEWGQIVKALLHSLWQGGVLTVLLGLALRRVSAPSLRYRFALGSLGAILLATVFTWAVLSQIPSRPGDQTGNSPLYPASALQTGQQLNASDETSVITVVGTRQINFTAPQMQWTGWLALCWLLGALLMLTRAGIQVAGAERLRRSGRPPADPRIAQLLAEAQRAVRLARKIRVTVTDTLTSPAVVGVLVPTLILPLSLLTTLTHEQLRFVLLHELAHIRRGDYFANLFQLFMEALLFFNPAVWWISHQVRREREACCDALATELSGAPVDYARTLVHVAESALSPPPAAAAAFGNKQREPSSLSDRVQRLLVSGYRPALRLTWRAMLISLVVGGTLLVVSALGTRTTVGAVLADAKRPKPETDVSDTNPRPILHAIGGGDGDRQVQGAASTNKTASGTSAPEAFAEKLYTRNFEVPTTRFSRMIGITNRNDGLPYITQAVTTDEGIRYLIRTNSMEAAHRAMRTLFADAGVDLQPPKSVFFNDRVGVLFVRATLADLDRLTEFLAEFSDTASLKTNAAAASLVQDARLLMEAGEREAPKAKLQLALEMEPANRAAKHYLGLITKSDEPGHQSQPTESTNGAQAKPLHDDREEAISPFNVQAGNMNLDSATGILTASNGVVIKHEGMVITADLARIDEEVGEVVAEGNARLSNHVGVMAGDRITFNYKTGKAKAERLSNGKTASPSNTSDAHEATNALPAPATELRQLTNRVPVLGDLPLIGRLFRSNESELSNIVADGVELHVRRYKVDRNTFTKNLEGTTAHQAKPTNVVAAVRDFFSISGVELEPPKSIYFNDRAGELLIRATREDLDIVEEVLQVLNAQAMQININVRFVEVDSQNGFGWIIGNMLLAATNSSTGDFPVQFSGILTEPQYQVVLRAMEERKDTKVLAMQQVTTSSGQQAQIQTVELKTVINGMNLPLPALPGHATTNSSSNPAYQTQVLPFGAVLDVIPYVAADGHTIQMTLLPTVSEFLGYDDPPKLLNGSRKLKGEAELPLPRMRVRQMTLNVNVWDGQTLFLGTASNEILSKKPDGSIDRSVSRDTNKQLLIFITPTIVDQGGNRMSAGDALPIERTSPAQTPKK